MISADFSYHCPQTIEEALSQYQSINARGQKPIFFNGGTEIISRLRANEMEADAVIDIKYISQCKDQTGNGENITIGSAVTLSQIEDAAPFPLLKMAAKNIATRTARNKITIGGNISSNLIYKEVALPFLLADSKAMVAGNEGIREESALNLFANGNQLNNGELIIQLNTEKKFADAPHFYRRQTRQSNVNYPLVTLCAMKHDQKIRVGLSGVYTFPFRRETIEEILNDSNLSLHSKVENAIGQLPEPIVNDFLSSAEFRKFLVKQFFTDMLAYFEGVS